jgi:hypothetical protein
MFTGWHQAPYHIRGSVRRGIVHDKNVHVVGNPFELTLQCLYDGTDILPLVYVGTMMTTFILTPH